MPRSLLVLLALGLAQAAPGAQLELPDDPRPPEPPRARTEEGADDDTPARGGARPAADAARRSDASVAEADPGEHGAARRLLERLRAIPEDEDAEPQGATAEELATRLLEREDGRPFLLSALNGDDPTALLAAARALLAQDRPENFPVVAARLAERLPAPAIGPLVDAVRTADPVRGGPALLVRLLDHPQSAMRHTARQHLERSAAPELLPHLVSVLGSSSRSDTRQTALQLAAKIDDPSVLHLLVDALGDRSARVASEASSLLAASGDARAVEVLRGVALPGRLLTENEQRRTAYALLALAEREQRTGEPLLGEDDVGALLEGLRSRHPARSGASAVALAGIGFRSPRPSETPWLDLEVPNALVGIAGGAVFHADFSSLQGPATERLALLSGHAFGSDGPAWQSWWAREAGTFRARRAVLHATPDDAARLRLVLSDPSEGARSFQLLGPDAGGLPEGPPVLYLTDLEARDLLGVVRREGLLGTERLPSPRGADEGARTLSLAIGERAKTFAVRHRAEPWFEAVADYARSLARRNRWQRYHDADRHPTQRDLWLAEREWWAEERDPLERGRRTIERILACWIDAEPDVRAAGLADLDALYADEALRSPEDLDGFLRGLAVEPDPTGRAARLVDLALSAAAGAGTDPAAAAGVRAVRGQEILQTVVERYGPRGEELIGRILAASAAEVAHAASADPRPYVRAAAAGALLRAGDEESRARFRALFDDDAAPVRAAAAREAGRSRDETWRALLLSRAADDDPDVRASALLGIGWFGGPDVRAALVEGLSAPHPAVRAAAAEGVARLGDPDDAPLLVSLLAEGPDSPLFAPARRGLLELGEAAWSDLSRAVHAGRGRVRRDAAFLLAEQGVPEIASTLLAWLTEDPEDARLAWELAVLTCMDMRGSSDPPTAWWEWWDLVVHDDATAWLRAALERAHIPSPPAEELGPPMTEDAAEALLAALAGDDEALAERARRELARLLGTDLGPRPSADEPREAWVADVQDAVRRHFAVEETD